MPKISVIVPIYKIEDYLSDCIISILSQSFTDFELILVDDGSPDNCGNICDEYAQIDRRVVVVHQRNAGVSASRNTGLDIATGQYISFIDGDDIVANDYLSVLYNMITINDSGISCCGFQKFSGENTISFVDRDTDSKVLEGKKLLKDIYADISYSPITLWGKLYKKYLFNNIRFPEGRIHEDQAILPIVIYSAETVCITDLVLYGYRQRSNSIMGEEFSVKRYDDLYSIDKCISFFANQEEYELVNLAQEKKKILIAEYSIEAINAGIFEFVPDQYKLSEYKALNYLRKKLPDQKYTYYLSKVHPNWVVPHEYLMRILRTLGINNNG